MLNPFALVEQDIIEMERIFNEELSSDASLILDVGRYIFGSGGKRFRPALHFLSAMLVGLKDPIRYRMGAALECLHTASLLHDDVLDCATLRRGKPAANTVWDNHTAVLVGDFLLTTAVKWILDTGDIALTRSVATVCARMAEGEAYQLKIARTRRLREDDYLRVVSHKTAGLISLCCYSAARLADLDGHYYQSLMKFGHNVGMAFQIVDDALDYSSETEHLGKSIGKDLEEGKITLPMLYALENAEASDRETLENILSSNPLNPEDLPVAQEIIQRNDGIDYALGRASGLVDEACEQLMSFDPCPARDALVKLAEFTVSRSN